jgi:hypothetical protein
VDLWPHDPVDPVKNNQSFEVFLKRFPQNVPISDPYAMNYVVSLKFKVSIKANVLSELVWHYSYWMRYWLRQEEYKMTMHQLMFVRPFLKLEFNSFEICP